MSDGLKFLASILENDATTELRDVDEQLFNEGSERDALNFIRRHLNAHRQLPTRDVILAELQESLPTHGVDAPGYHLRRLSNRYFYNTVKPYVGWLREALMSSDHDRMRGLIGELQALARSTPDSEHRILDTQTIYNQIIERYMADREHRDEEVRGVPTGWSWLDEQTGGWQQGDIITLAARPEIGKTWILIHCAYRAWTANRSVLFFTTEMPPRQVGARFLGYQTGVNPKLLRTLQLSRWGERRLFEAMESVETDTRLKIIEASGKSTQWVEDLIHEYEPDLVCIDGCYLLQPSTGRRDAGRFEKIGNVFDDINAMKLHTNRPILVTTQMNREAGEGGKSGSLETLGYSDAIGTHSSIIFQIKPWPHYATVGGEELWFHPAQARMIQSLKGREGPIPPFGVFYNPPRGFDRIVTASFARRGSDDDMRQRRRRDVNFTVGPQNG